MARPRYITPLARALRDGLDGVTTRIVDRVGRAAPDVYGPGANAEFLAEYDACVREILCLLVSRWLEGPVDAGENLRAMGSHRAEQGIPLTAIQRSLAFAFDEGWNFLVEHARGLPQGLELTASLDWMHRDAFGFEVWTTAEITKGHNEVSASTAAEMFADLLAGHDGPDVVSRAAALGLDLGAPHGLMLAIAPADDAGRHARRHAALALARRVGAVLAGSAPGYSVLLVPATTASVWEAAIEEARRLVSTVLTIITAEPVTRPRLIHEALDGALAVMEFAPRVAGGRVIGVAELRPYRVLKWVPPTEVDWFVQQVAGSLGGHHGVRLRELMETVEAMRASGGRTKEAAERLGVDRATVRRRVSKVERLTGRRILDAELALLVYLLKMHHMGAPLA